MSKKVNELVLQLTKRTIAVNDTRQAWGKAEDLQKEAALDLIKDHVRECREQGVPYIYVGDTDNWAVFIWGNDAVYNNAHSPKRENEQPVHTLGLNQVLIIEDKMRKFLHPEYNVKLDDDDDI